MSARLFWWIRAQRFKGMSCSAVWVASVPARSWQCEKPVAGPGQAADPCPAVDGRASQAPRPARKRCTLSLPVPQWLQARVTSAGFGDLPPGPTTRRAEPECGIQGLAFVQFGSERRGPFRSVWGAEARVLYEFHCRPLDSYTAHVVDVARLPQPMQVSQYKRLPARGNRQALQAAPVKNSFPFV